MTTKQDERKDGNRRLTVAEIERLPREEFDALPEKDKERYYESMDRENFPTPWEFYEYEKERTPDEPWTDDAESCEGHEATPEKYDAESLFGEVYFQLHAAAGHRTWLFSRRHRDREGSRFQNPGGPDRCRVGRISSRSPRTSRARTRRAVSGMSSGWAATASAAARATGRKSFFNCTSGTTTGREGRPS